MTPSGQTIVIEILAEMEERLYPLMQRTLPPGMFHVYLHPDDFRQIEGIVSLIVLDAQQALNARVDELNRRPLWSSLVSGRRPPIDIPSSGWDISIHPDANGEIECGQLGIESRLSVPPPPRYEGGTPTARIGRTVITGAIRRSQPAEETSGSLVGSDSGPRFVHRQAVDAPGGANTAGTSDASAHAGRAAKLSYVDDTGSHVFLMRKDLISIGRGGSAHWVDVQVVTTPRVSREHCRIRKAADGRFFLQDVSSWGTSIDGRAVEPFARQIDGRIEETGREHELAGRARIQLADAVEIDFSVER